MNFWKNLVTCGRCQDIELINNRFDEISSAVKDCMITVRENTSKLCHVKHELSDLKIKYERIIKEISLPKENKKQKSQKTIAPQ